MPLGQCALKLRQVGTRGFKRDGPESARGSDNGIKGFECGAEPLMMLILFERVKVLMRLFF